MSREIVEIEPGQKDVLPENDLGDVGSSDGMTRRDFLKLSASTAGGAAIGPVVTEGVNSLERMQQWNEIGASIKELRQKITGNDGHPSIHSEKITGEFGQITHEISFSTIDNKDYHIGGLTQADNLELVRLISGDGNLTGINWDASGDRWKIPLMMGIAGQGVLSRRNFLLGITTGIIAAQASKIYLFPGKPPEGLSATATATLQGLKESENNPPRPTGNNSPTPISTPFRADVTSTIAPDGSIKITATPKPTLFPSPTSTPESSPTLTIRSRFTPKEWVPKVPENATVNKEMIGKSDPKNLYPLVGAVDLKHRKSLDLQFGAAKIVAVTDQDMKAKPITPERQNGWREAISTKLETKTSPYNGANGLGHDVQGAISLVKDLKKDKVKEDDIYVVLEGTKVSVDLQNKPVADTGDAKIAQVIVKVGDNYERYKYIGENGFAQLVPFAKAGAREMDKDNPEKAEFALLPKLQISGKNIINPNDNNSVVQLLGANIPHPAHDNSQHPLSASLEALDTAKSNVMNVVRLNYSTDIILSKISEMKQIVEKAELMGMYVIFTPGSKAKNKYSDLDYPGSEEIGVIAGLAQELKPYNNVIYDIWNEPKLVEWENGLYNSVRNTIKSVRAVNPDSIMMIPGTKWSRDFGHLREHPLKSDDGSPFGNLMYGVTASPWLHRDPNTKNVKTNIGKDGVNNYGSDWEWIIDKSPVFVREFGLLDTVGNVPNIKELSDEWIDRYIGYIKDRKLSATQFILSTNPNSITSPIDKTGKHLSRWTKYFDLLKTSPPSQFDQ